MTDPFGSPCPHGIHHAETSRGEGILISVCVQCFRQLRDGHPPVQPRPRHVGPPQPQTIEPSYLPPPPGAAPWMTGHLTGTCTSCGLNHAHCICPHGPAT